MQLEGKLQTNGYTTNLILVNSGQKISVFAIMIVLIPATKALLAIQNVPFREKLLKLEKSFKFTMFLRYFILVHFELFINSVIGILYTRLENSVQIVDFFICFLALVNLI